VQAALGLAALALLAFVAVPLLAAPALDRPYLTGAAERLVVRPAGTSWPSGHAAVAAALAATLGEGRGPAVRGLLTASAAAVGVSRVYVGVHHASDVVAGFGLGGLTASLLRGFRARARVRR